MKVFWPVLRLVLPLHVLYNGHSQLPLTANRKYIWPRDLNLLNKTNMQNIPDIRAVPSHNTKSESIAVTVVIPTRNEARHLARCLESIRGFSEVYVVDSQSTDSTVEVARAFGAKVVQFHYHGGWPKKRQWALDTLPF